MNTGKLYQDSDGNDCSIMQMVRREPEWAANRVQAGEAAIVKLDEVMEEIHRLRSLEDSYDTEDQVLAELLLGLNKLCGT